MIYNEARFENSFSRIITVSVYFFTLSFFFPQQSFSPERITATLPRSHDHGEYKFN